MGNKDKNFVAHKVHRMIIFYSKTSTQFFIRLFKSFKQRKKEEFRSKSSK